MSPPHRQLSKFIAIFAGGTMISRVTGLVREMVFAHVIPTPVRGVFYFAFRLPNMLRDLVGEGATNAAFVPVLSETLEKDKEAAFRELTSALMSAMVVLLSVITAVGLLLMPFIVRFLNAIAPYTGGQVFSEAELNEITTITRWLFPYVFFIGLTVFQMGPLFIKHHYSTPSWAPALLNVCLILTAWLLRDWFAHPAYTLVVGVWLGGIAQFAIQNRAMRKHVGVWLPNFHLRHPGIRKALWLLVPVVLGQSAGEVNKFVDMSVAYNLGAEIMSALWYSNILVQLPLSIFGIAISVAILPAISRAITRDDYAEAKDTLKMGLRQCLFLVAPAVAALMVCARPIVRLLFEGGEFTPEDTALTSTALVYLAPGLLCFAWVKVSVSGFYAMKNTKTPVTIAFASMVTNTVLIIAMVRPLGFVALPLATTIAYGLNFALLYVFLGRRYGALWDSAMAVSLSKIVVSAAAMAAVMHFTLGAMTDRFNTGGLLNEIFLVAAPLGAGCATYAALCYATRIPEFQVFASLTRRAPAPEPIADQPMD